MMQSDFQRKKNFANPQHFFNTTNNANDKKPAASQPTTARRDSEKSTTSNNNNNNNNKAEESKTENANNDNNTEEVRSEFLMKHPLQNTWTLWYLENDRTKAWEDMLNEITSIDTVEDFWSLYNHIKPPSEIKSGSDYSLFKKDIRPMWEDAANKQGGRWVITLAKNCRQDLDNLWLDVLLCLIGETFDNSDQICGAVVNIRQKNNKISIWTADGGNEEAALEIGSKLRDALRLNRSQLQYQLHKDTMVKHGSSVKSIYVL